MNRLTVYVKDIPENREPSRKYEWQEKVGSVMTTKQLIVPFVFQTTFAFKNVKEKDIHGIINTFSNKQLRKVQWGNKIIFDSGF